MKASQVRLSDLDTYDQCEQAIADIENDYCNVIGGFRAWNSGNETHLTAAAEKKIAAIRARSDRLLGEESESV